jgi:hypothetical protein
MSETELEVLRHDIAQLRAELDELRRAPAPPVAKSAPSVAQEPSPISRRHALRTAGVVAAGALAGGIATVASAGPAAAATGNFTGDPAVTADAQTGTGVAATSVSGSGTIGLVGTATAAGTTGVRGDATNTTSGSGGSFSGPNGVTINGSMVTAQLGLSAGGPPALINRAYNQGALVVDNAGALWYCVTSGTPGTWRQLSGATTAGAFHPVTPGRVYDSRCA